VKAEYTTYPPGLLDSGLILGMFSDEKARAITGFREFNEAENLDRCLVNEKIKRLTDEQARAVINELITVTEMVQIKRLPKGQRGEIISRIKKVEGLTQRQAARMLGASPNLIFKA